MATEDEIKKFAEELIKLVPDITDAQLDEQIQIEFPDLAPAPRPRPPLAGTTTPAPPPPPPKSQPGFLERAGERLAAPFRDAPGINPETIPTIFGKERKDLSRLETDALFALNLGAVPLEFMGDIFQGVVGVAGEAVKGLGPGKRAERSAENFLNFFGIQSGIQLGAGFGGISGVRAGTQARIVDRLLKKGKSTETPIKFNRVKPSRPTVGEVRLQDELRTTDLQIQNFAAALKDPKTKNADKRAIAEARQLAMARRNQLHDRVKEARANRLEADAARRRPAEATEFEKARAKLEKKTGKLTDDDLIQMIRSDTQLGAGLGAAEVGASKTGAVETAVPQRTLGQVAFTAAQAIPRTTRIAMVVKPGTAARNAAVTGGRLFLNVISDITELIASRGKDMMFGTVSPNRIPFKSIGSDLRFVIRAIRRGGKSNAKLIDQLLQANPKQADRLFTRIFSEDMGPMTAPTRRAIEFALVFNRLQEFIFRRGIVASRLDKTMRQRHNRSFVDVMEKKDFDLIDDDTLRKAIDGALDLTFAKDPSTKTAAGRLGNHFIGMFSFPGMDLAIPFPRFVTNAIRFQYENSPLSAWKLATPKEWAKMAKGDFSTIGKQAVGGTLLYTAHQIRNSKYAGPEWYQLRLEDGTIVDTRSFNPLASYLFVADLHKRVTEGTLFQLDPKDFLQSLAGINARTGSGVAVLDRLMDTVTGIRDENGVTEFFTTVTGEYARRLLTFLGVARDISASDIPTRMVKKFGELTGKDIGAIAETLQDFAEEESKQRMTESEDPVVDLERKVKGQVPGFSQELPERFSGTGTPQRKVDPALQAVGVPLRPKQSDFEDALGLYQFTQQEKFPSTGIPELDNMVREEANPISADIGNAIVRSPGFKNLSISQQSLVLQKTLEGIRAAARVRVLLRPDAAPFRALLKEQNISTRTIRVIDDELKRVNPDLPSLRAIIANRARYE